MPRLVALQACATAAFVGLGLAAAPAIVLVALALTMGSGQAPWSSVMRSVLPRLLEDPALQSTVFALDSVLVEISFTLGALLTGVLVSLFSPATALLTAAACATLGAMAFVAGPVFDDWPVDAAASRHLIHAMRNRALLTIVMATLPAGFALGAVEVALPSFAARHGAADAAGFLLAAWSVGSGLGGAAYGALDWRRPLAQVWVGLTCSLAVAMVPLLLASSVGVLAALLVLASASAAPLLACGGQILGTISQAGTATEAYAWGRCRSSSESPAAPRRADS